MASIRTRKNKDGSTTYQVDIRKKDFTICKSFNDLETAKLYEFWKENLIDNMNNFEVPIENRVTLRQAFEKKIDSVDKDNARQILDLRYSCDKLCAILGEKFLAVITYEEWLEASKKLFQTQVYRGSKKEKNARPMSPKTLMRIFANASSAISYLNERGIRADNHPLKVIHSFIRPVLIKNDK